MSSYPRKRLVKEQITIYTDSQVTVAASGTKSLLVAVCIEKLTVLSEVNQLIIIWVPGHSGIQQTETADRLASKGARTRPIGLKPFLSLSLSRFKSKIRNWIEKRKQTEWKVFEKYGTRQQGLERPTDRYIHFISKLDRKHFRILVGLLTGHINLQYMLHKMKRAKTSSCRRCGAEKEMSVHMPCECPVLKKSKDADCGLCQDGFGTNRRGDAEWDHGPR